MKHTVMMICSLLCISGITGCAYSPQKQPSEELWTTEALPEQEEDTGPDESMETIADTTYEMQLYTKAPNEKSSVKIQYPVFSGNQAEELNSLVLTKVEYMAALDPLRFSGNPKKIANYQSAVTLQNSKVISIVFWGNVDIDVSQFPTTNLHVLNIDRASLELITIQDLYTINEEFEKIYFEKAFFPANPITSFSEEEFPYMLKVQTREYDSLGPFYSPNYIRFYLKPEGIVLSMSSVHASGSDHFEAELLYSDIQEFYLPEQLYWED